MLYGVKRFFAALNKRQINLLTNRGVETFNLENFVTKPLTSANLNDVSSITRHFVRDKLLPIKSVRKLNGNSHNGPKQDNQTIVSNASILLSGGAIALLQYEYYLGKNRSGTGKIVHCLGEEESLQQLLGAAYLNNDYNGQCKNLDKLAQWHLQQQDYSTAAKLLNGALAIAQNYADSIVGAKRLEEELVSQLGAIEPAFVIEKLQCDYKALPENQGINPQHKQRLIELREEVKQKLRDLDGGNDFFDERISIKTQLLFKWIAKQIKMLLNEMMQDCIRLMPTSPPCDYALIATGSLAREEMTPYSDLECFILVAEDKPEYKQYFRQLSQLLELKIINLGETDLVKGQDLLPSMMLSPTKKGFSLDIHKNPNNNKRNLIKTPEEMAQYQLPQQFTHESGNHLSVSLLSATLITGSSGAERLLIEYKKKVRNILRQIEPGAQKEIRIVRALSILKQDSTSFIPQFGLQEEGKLFKIKDDFYRLPHTSIDGLALYYDLNSDSTWNRIDELSNKQLLSKEAGSNLKTLFSQITKWRLQAYSDHAYQRELVDILLSRDIETQGLIIDAYKILIPLHEYVKAFYEGKGDSLARKGASMYDDSPLIMGDIYARLCLYPQAAESYECASSGTEGADKALSLYGLGSVRFTSGAPREAVDCTKRALEIDIATHGPFSDAVGRDYNGLGLALKRCGEFRYALLALSKALEVSKRALGSSPSNNKPRSDEFIINNNIGGVWLALGQIEKALEYFNTALDGLIGIYGENDIRVAKVRGSIGSAYMELGQPTEALDFYEKALSVNRDIYGSKHPSTIYSLVTVGWAYYNIGDIKKAENYYKSAQLAGEEVFGKEHFEFAGILNHIGILSCNQGELEKGISLHCQALDILLKAHGQDHFDVAKTYQNLATACFKANDVNNAITCQQKALKIDLKIFGDRHPNIARHCLSLSIYLYHRMLLNLDKNIANIALVLGYANLALTINQNAYDDRHHSVAGNFYHLGCIYEFCTQYAEALKCYERSLEVLIAVYEDGCNSPDMLKTKDKINSIKQKLEQDRKVPSKLALLLPLKLH